MIKNGKKNLFLTRNVENWGKEITRLLSVSSYNSAPNRETYID